MIRRSAFIAAEILVGVIAVAVLLTGLAIWRLSMGPVDLDLLTPEIEAALSDPKSGVAVRIGKTQLTWEGWQRTIDLHARDVRVRDAGGAILAALPDVVLRLSLRALVQGTVAPTMVEIFGARLSLLRRADGTFQFGPWDESGEIGAAAVASDGDFSRLVPDLIGRLLAPPTPADPLSFLRVLRIAGGRVAVNDRKLGFAWTAPFADIELQRDDDGLAGEATLKVDLGGRQASLFALFDYSQPLERIDMTVHFSDVMPQAIVSLTPGLTAIGGLTMPLTGTASVSLDDKGTLRDMLFDIRGGAGTFAHEDLFAAPLAVESFAATGTVIAAERRMTLDRAVVEFGEAAEHGPRVTLAGTITSAAEGFHGDLEVEARATAEGVAMAELARYWPIGIADSPREWVIENVNQGTTRKATLDAAFTAPGGDFSAAELHTLGGTFDYEDIAVHFLRPMPPVTGISGSAEFDDDRMTFRPDGGRLGALKIEDARIEITGLRPAREVMKIDLAVEGPLSDALSLLDHDRLKLIRQLDMEADTIQGQMAGRVRFDFPLLKDLGTDNIKVAAVADLDRVSAQHVLLGQDVANGRLKLVLDKSGMHLTGPVVFAGIDLEVSWAEAFVERKAEQTRIELMAKRVDAAQRAALGIELAPYLTGPLSANVIARRDREKNTRIELALGLSEARVEVPPVPWYKAPGVKGSALATLELSDDRLKRIAKLALDAGTLHASGTADFDAAGRGLRRIELDRLAVAASELTGVDIDLSGETPRLKIAGGVLDARPWLKDAQAPEGQDATAGERPPQGREPPPRPFRLVAPNLDAVFFGPDRYLERVKLDVHRSETGWEMASMRGAVPRSLWHSPKGTSGADLSGDTPKTVALDYGADGKGGKRLSVTAEDAGAVLRALDFADTLNGGRVVIEGTSDGPLPGAKLNGRIEGHDYVLVGAPNMARLLTVASLTGIGDLLSGEGIGFQRLVGNFTLENGVMTSDLIRAYGPALGLTAKGTIDFERNETALQGTIVPAYTVNRIIGEIPLLGPLLTGGKGEGVFAATYRMSGPIGDPEVSVNTLAALAPGFLRSLFSGSSVDEGEARALPERIEP